MKTLIWDYNGTILDDTAMTFGIELEMLAKRHMKNDYTLDEYRNMFCFPVIDYYYKLGYTFENETYEEISVEFNDMYDERFDTCPLTEGFTEMILKAKELGYKNVILSACRHDKLLAQTKRLGIDIYFDEMLGIDNLLAGSKTEMAKKWMRDTGTDPADCVFVGDTTHDYETAAAMGVKRIILTATGHQSFDVLKKTGAEVVNSLKEITL